MDDLFQVVAASGDIGTLALLLAIYKIDRCVSQLEFRADAG